MNWPGIGTLAVLINLIFAEAINIVPQEDLILPYHEVIQPATTFSMPNIKNLRCDNIFRNKGGFEAQVRSGGTMIFNGFVNDCDAWVTIDGAGDLNLTIRDSFANFGKANFEVNIMETLNIHLDSQNEFSNSGEFFLAAGTINLELNKITNWDKVAILATGKGVFEFKSIFNFNKFQIQSGSDSSLSFEKLFNDGEFAFGCKRCQEAVVDARGLLSNNGIIRMDVDFGRGVLNQGGMILNDGLMCLSSSTFHHTDEVIGKGCWAISFDGCLEIDGSKPFATTQKIFLGDCSAHILISQFGEEEIVFDLYGFQKADCPIRSSHKIKRATYNSTTGHLRVILERNQHLVFGIDRGLQESAFRVEGHKVWYEGDLAPEKVVPLSCQCRRITASSIGKEEGNTSNVLKFDTDKVKDAPNDDHGIPLANIESRIET